MLVKNTVKNFLLFSLLLYLIISVFIILKNKEEIREVVFKNEQKEVVYILDEFEANVTCYNSMINQCDSDPFKTANGHILKEGDMVVANNYFPFGTKVEINGEVYIVQDRMNSRYGKNTFDIWFGDETTYSECLEFGSKLLTVKIIK